MPKISAAAGATTAANIPVDADGRPREIEVHPLTLVPPGPAADPTAVKPFVDADGTNPANYPHEDGVAPGVQVSPLPGPPAVDEETGVRELDSGETPESAAEDDAEARHRLEGDTEDDSTGDPEAGDDTGAPSTVEVATDTNYTRWDEDDLREELRKRQLPDNGVKATLVRRLRGNDLGATGDSTTP